MLYVTCLPASGCKAGSHFGAARPFNKLLFSQPLRYSEDIDLVQTHAEPIGQTAHAIADALAWLGGCRTERAAHSMHFVFRFTPEAGGGGQLKLKVEINTREHTSFCGLKEYAFAMDNSWHQAKARILSFEPDELFGTKLRALLQRNKNRDLFDLNQGLHQLGLDCDRVIACLQHYLVLEEHAISRANAEERMLKKLNQSLVEDVTPLLPTGVTFDADDAIAAFGRVWGTLIRRIPGEPWRSSKKVIDAIRAAKYPSLLSGIEL